MDGNCRPCCMDIACHSFLKVPLNAFQAAIAISTILSSGGQRPQGDVLGGRAAAVPEAVHAEMAKMAKEGRIPRSTPEARVRNMGTGKLSQQDITSRWVSHFLVQAQVADAGTKLLRTICNIY